MSALSWTRFYLQAKADFKLWCYFVLFQQLCRLAFLYTLSNYLALDTHFHTIVFAMLRGLWFDCLWATIWLSIAFLGFTLPSLFSRLNPQEYLNVTRWRRQYWGGAFTFITTIIYIINVEHYRACKDIFNQFLFGVLYDDQAAILKTIITEHRIGLHLTVLAIIFLVLLLYVAGSRYLIFRKNLSFADNSGATVYKFTGTHKIILPGCLLMFYVLGLHGCMLPLVWQLQYSKATPDPFLNKAILSPYTALMHATTEYLAIHNNKGYRYKIRTKQEMREIAQKYFHNNAIYPRLTDYMQKIAPGAKLPQVKHIFLIVGESLDAWPLQPQYQQFNLTPNLNKLIQQGLHLKYFLPCANGTMPALTTIITGLHDAELLMNTQQNSVKPYRTAIAMQFKNLGFKPQLFYGGYLAWQHLQDFAYAQGFSAVYGASHINNWQQTNEWGGDDRTLFAFISKIIQQATTPTFNLIMTTSNHPPFSIDLAAEGFASQHAAQLLTQYPNTEMRAKELGHIWYADKAIGEFVQEITNFDSNALFAITGDHFGMRHILPNPPFFDTSAVPLILYNTHIKQHYKFPNASAGSHIDIVPTLLDLVAPQGFAYYALGKNLFSKSENALGIGQQKIITPDFIAVTNAPEIMYFKQENKYIAREHINALIERHERAMALAWWLIKKSDEL